MRMGFPTQSVCVLQLETESGKFRVGQSANLQGKHFKTLHMHFAGMLHAL